MGQAAGPSDASPHQHSDLQAAWHSAMNTSQAPFWQRGPDMRVLSEGKVPHNALRCRSISDCPGRNRFIALVIEEPNSAQVRCFLPVVALSFSSVRHVRSSTTAYVTD